LGLQKGLKDVRLLSLRFMSILALYAMDPNRELVAKAKKILYQCIEARRHLISTNSTLEASTKAALLPENAVPYIVHLIAHLPSFSYTKDFFAEVHRYLTFFLEPILHGATNNFPFLVELLAFITRTQDAQDAFEEAPFTLQCLCEICDATSRDHPARSFQ